MPENESMILADGSLIAKIPRSDVDWFEFKDLSRILNSKLGGWNSKEYWQSRALLNLENSPDMVLLWTNNSLRDASGSPPRTQDFRFAERLKDRGVSAPAAGHTSENLLNWDLFQSKSLVLDGLACDLLSYEVPLSKSSDGQLKIDLLGIAHGGKNLVIIELKKGNNRSDSPPMAFVETICYAIQVKKCWASLGREIAHHFKDRLGDDGAPATELVHLCLLAPREYWDYWLGFGSDKAGLKTRLEKILAEVNKAPALAGLQFALHLANTEDANRL